MILDCSSVIGILLKEADHDSLQTRLTAAPHVGIGAPTLVETAVVLCARLGPAGKSLLARFVEEAEIDVIAFAAEHWTVAVDAYTRYGKGRDAAGLNFGDCLTYAVSKVADEPLLCKGDDFSATDVTLAGGISGEADPDAGQQ